jgi:hypothetical protein
MFRLEELYSAAYLPCVFLCDVVGFFDGLNRLVSIQWDEPHATAIWAIFKQ